MTREVKIKNSDLTKKLQIIGALFFNSLSAAETQTLTTLIASSESNTAVLSPDLRGSATQSTFSTSIARLTKKGVIRRAGKSITLHPVFTDIEKLDVLSIIFEG